MRPQDYFFLEVAKSAPLEGYDFFGALWGSGVRGGGGRRGQELLKKNNPVEKK